MARKKRKRDLKETLPIVIGAGLTERRYFEHLKELCSFKVKLKPRFFGRDNASAMGQILKTNLCDGVTAICVFDMDVTQWDEKEKKRLSEFVNTYKNNQSVILCGSMPSIEYWFLLHYKDTHKAYATSDNVIEDLHKYIQNYAKTDDFLKNSKWVTDMIAENRMSIAIDRSKNRKPNDESYSDVWKAIEFLKGR